MNKLFSKIISTVFHPLILPSLGMIVFFNSGSYLDFLPFNAKKIILLVVFVSTFVLPLTFVPFYLFQNIIKSIQMESNRERLIPLAVSSILYFFSYYLLARLGVPEIINRFILAGAIAIIILFILSIKWKISAHMVGIGGFTGALIALSFELQTNLQYYIIGAILISGAIAYSRLALQIHTQKQIYIGWFTGLLTTVLTILLF
ncbi:MAG: hypothetical protein A2X13_02820 [Bacteroidetes bacterium GWC2_33_15]|nr:MAG: hypothetical protein A2X10_05340 [Bacteroidetes bacterium GWA2_33_15]OFX49419.1 MAG: hypothetical protein A2X13_02820 [Bacteroidetes bacterium GWC2_33_15]OFX62988.1 MAG: hypothetical protein A2X15_10055 [Bacteroidetes bacterium GWB2_32_14]OFX68767.1 MAG: hypothetical protein A2X14_14345 [Bacteroidetes bacterium GWD2_33_33]HAN19058.1 hypothetical protein [Bacteroidales bacterium]